MPKLKLLVALSNWQTKEFPSALKNEIENLDLGSLPLDKCTCQGGFVDDSNIDATVLTINDDEDFIQAKVGIFFSEVVVSYCCEEEEPMVKNAYCEIIFRINKVSAETGFEVIND